MARYALLFSYTSDAWARLINSPATGPQRRGEWSTRWAERFECAYVMFGDP